MFTVNLARSLAVLLLTVSILPTCFVRAEDVQKKASIVWAKSLDAANKQSAADGRPVLAYFTFNACHWCKKLEQACFFDADVVKLSRKFIWVKVNRDVTPAIPKRLNVFAYPSLLTLGGKDENIFRFQSYQQPPEFMANLKQALQRYERYKKGQDWMAAPSRPAQISSEAVIQRIKTPAETVPGGMTELDGSIWIAQGQLFQLDPSNGKTIKKLSLPTSVGDLCNDGKQLYAVSYGWTAGKPIYVIDPRNGKVVREIITEANKKHRAHGAKGIAWHGGSLYVLAGMRGRLFQISPETGEIKKETQLSGTWLTGLDFDGRHFLTGSRTHLFKFDPVSGKSVWKKAVNYPLRNVAFSGEHLLVTEQPLFGFGRKHERVRVWPKKTNIYRLAFKARAKQSPQD